MNKLGLLVIAMLATGVALASTLPANAQNVNHDFLMGSMMGEQQGREEAGNGGYGGYVSLGKMYVAQVFQLQPDGPKYKWKVDPLTSKIQCLQRPKGVAPLTGPQPGDVLEPHLPAPESSNTLPVHIKVKRKGETLDLVIYHPSNESYMWGRFSRNWETVMGNYPAPPSAYGCPPKLSSLEETRQLLEFTLARGSAFLASKTATPEVLRAAYDVEHSLTATPEQKAEARAILDKEAQQLTQDKAAAEKEKLDNEVQLVHDAANGSQ